MIGLIVMLKFGNGNMNINSTVTKKSHETVYSDENSKLIHIENQFTLFKI